MSDIFEIGLSGLQAAQIGLATTGQNITNAKNPDYSLQKAMQVAIPEQGFGFGYVGRGVQVSTIVRQYDSWLAKQINTLESHAGQSSSYLDLMMPINNIVANAKTGLSPVLQSFFASLQNITTNPSSVPALQTSLSQAENLVSQFHALQTQLDQSHSSLNTQITDSVSKINDYAKQLASLNQAIQAGYINANNQPPNDLLDQRDALINRLSKEIQVSIIPEGNQYNIFIGNGQPLVMGGHTTVLQVVPSAKNAHDLDVAYEFNGQVFSINENSLSSGRLGGLINYRNHSLSSIQNTLGQIAIVLGTALNEQNQLGQTITGDMGRPLFNLPQGVVYANANNTGNAQLAANITDASALTADNYRLSFDGTNYTILNVTTNTTLSTFAAFPAVPTQGVNIIDGVTFTLTSGAMAAGDRFDISPAAQGAAGLSLAMTAPTDFASAAPVATSVATTNTGTGTITPGAVTKGFTPQSVNPPITLTYNGTSAGLTGFPAGANIVVTNNGNSTTYANYVPGTPIPYASGMTISFNNITVGLSGNLADADVFTIGPNTNGVGDSRNMILMSELLTKNTIANGTMSFQGAYASMVSTIGSTTAQLTAMNTTDANLIKSSRAQQKSLSGVNLDEETVNLLQYQFAYQASGKVIQVARENFSLLVSLTD